MDDEALLPDCALDEESEDAERAIIVGIGASAGGLEALTQLVANLPKRGRISYVVAQHMSPQHKSMMVDLLARATTLPVVEATEGQKLQSNTIYITPPNRNIEIRDQTVVLTGPYAEGPKPSVDLLFISLAEDVGDRIVGIILSGTGSDGARGVQAIKSVGGMTIAQSPDTAKYNGMPEAALRTGRIDKVLAPDQIGHELAYLVSQPRSASGAPRPTPAAEAEPAPENHDFPEPYGVVIGMIRKRMNIDFQQYKPGTIHRRVQRRLAANRLTSLDDYVEYLTTHPDEVERLCSDILISVTSFFRDRPSWQALGSAIERLLDSKPVREPLRIWVPGCATGEEAYSIGIVISEQLYKRGEVRPVQIFAVDIDEAALVVARRGVYPASAVEDLEDALVSRYMTRIDSTIQIDRQLRDMVVFSKQDITRDPPFSHIDLISCRNLLIYFNNELQSRIIKLFAYALNPGAILFLGKSEALGNDEDVLFSPLDHSHKIFVRSATGRIPLNQIGGRLIEIGGPKPLPRSKADAPALPVLVKTTMGEIYGPPSIVVDPSLRVVYIHGDVSAHIKLSDGKFDQDIMALIAPSLRTTLRAVLHRSERGDKEHSEDRPESLTIRLPTTEGSSSIRITVRPLGNRPGQPPPLLRLVTFEDCQPEPTSRAMITEAPADDPRIAEYEHELTVTREHLQTVIEELESANEELQSTNEELQSSNEELQATNEELETTNEELQSTNEELQTVNDELQAKSLELSQKAADLQNIEASIESPLLVVDRDLRVRLFNDAAKSIFDISQTDLGVPITQLPTRLDIIDLKRKLLRVIEFGQISRQDVTDDFGRVYAMTVTPYRNSDKVIVGAIFSAVDVTERVQSEVRLRELTRQLNEAQRIAHVGSWRWQVNTEDLVWSPELFRISGLDPDDFKLGWETAINIYHPDDRQTVRTSLETARLNRTGFGFEARLVRPGGEIRHVRVTGLSKLDDRNASETMFGVVKDITEEVRASQLLMESYTRLSTIMNTILEGIIVIDTKGIIRLANTAVTKMFGYTEQELIGRNVSILQPDPVYRHHDSYLDNYLKTGVKKIIGVGREVQGRRKDGSLFPIELSVGEVIDELASGDASNNHVFIGTLRDITARKRYEEALVLSKRDAESANEAKSMFLAKMSHELRTPLNAILGFSEVMRDQLFGPLNNDKYIRYLTDIHSSGEHLLNLINDILDLSRIESGKFKIDEEIVVVGQVIAKCIALFEEQAKRKRLALSAKAPDDLPRLRADGRSIRQILLNLLSNAVKFTGDGGSVEVIAALHDNGNLALIVRDTGIGMTKEEIAMAFQPFSRSDGAKHRENEGAGLGMFISKSLIELHGANLAIASEVGQGTTVTVTFPANRIVKS
ncbi:MAG: PAS domain S-box protein [Azospirillum sp.]|nr:PAS domain S-box protein [Azospirillum sp.]